MKILLSLLSSAGIISSASMPLINNNIASPYLSTIDQKIDSVVSIERTGSSGMGTNSDNRSLQNLKELDPVITYSDLLNNEIILQIDGQINLLTTIDQKNINLIDLTIVKTSEAITATFEDSIVSVTSNVNQSAKVKVELKIDKDLNVLFNTQVEVNSLIGDGRAVAKSTIQSMKLIY